GDRDPRGGLNKSRGVGVSLRHWVGVEGMGFDERIPGAGEAKENQLIKKKQLLWSPNPFISIKSQYRDQIIYLLRVSKEKQHSSGKCLYITISVPRVFISSLYIILQAVLFLIYKEGL
ncbi:MAG: hypothetical protein QXI22_09090, partial [Sulfolobales archaeon]